MSCGERGAVRVRRPVSGTRPKRTVTSLICAKFVEMSMFAAIPAADAAADAGGGGAALPTCCGGAAPPCWT